MHNSNFKYIRAQFIDKAKEHISKAYKNDEISLIQFINTYENLRRSYNLNFEKLSEWYRIYFPKLEINNPSEFIKLIIAMEGGIRVDTEAIMAITTNKNIIDSIFNKVTLDIGRKITLEEAKTIEGLAILSSSIEAQLKNLEMYIDNGAKKLMPNTTYLTNSKIAAELLSKAGSMKELAFMPAGTIQMLGAEKALFMHRKFGVNAPKYGILYKLPEIESAEKQIRGKLARVYSNKIFVAIKADYFSRNFIAEKLKVDIILIKSRIEKTPRKMKAQRYSPEKFIKNKYVENKQDRYYNKYMNNRNHKHFYKVNKNLGSSNHIESKTFKSKSQYNNNNFNFDKSNKKFRRFRKHSYK